MRNALRGLRLVGHVLFTALALVWLTVTRRGATLVFTHAADVDTSGLDRQMGALVAGLTARRRPFQEVILVSLDGGLGACLVRTRRPFLSLAALRGSARLLSLLTPLRPERARLLVGRCLLWCLRPRALYLIDESGSGQMLAAAGRALGIPTIGVQHGDFQRFNPQYALEGPVSEAMVAVDVLAVWSPWFRERLLAVSPLYDATNTRVVGRLQPVPELPARARADRTSVLLLGEYRGGWEDEALPYARALARAASVELRIRLHPGADELSWPEMECSRGTLEEDLVWADVVLGIGSSALLEALRVGRPVVVLGSDPAGYAEAGVAELCTDPETLSGLCVRFAASDPVDTQREHSVWGGAPEDPVAAILECESASFSLSPRVLRSETRGRGTESAA